MSHHCWLQCGGQPREVGFTCLEISRRQTSKLWILFLAKLFKNYGKTKHQLNKQKPKNEADRILFICTATVTMYSYLRQHFLYSRLASDLMCKDDGSQCQSYGCAPLFSVSIVLWTKQTRLTICQEALANPTTYYIYIYALQ